MDLKENRKAHVEMFWRAEREGRHVIKLQT